jgi:translation initiation factor IF-1
MIQEYKLANASLKEPLKAGMIEIKLENGGIIRCH